METLRSCCKLNKRHEFLIGCRLRLLLHESDRRKIKSSMTITGYKGELSKTGGGNMSLTHRTCIMPNTGLRTSSTQVRNQPVSIV